MNTCYPGMYCDPVIVEHLKEPLVALRVHRPTANPGAQPHGLDEVGGDSFVSTRIPPFSNA